MAEKRFEITYGYNQFDEPQTEIVEAKTRARAVNKFWESGEFLDDNEDLRIFNIKLIEEEKVSEKR
jgi:hypothetical protein